MTNADPEANLLNACIRLNLAVGESAAKIAPLLARVNWHRLLWLGRHHGVLLFLEDALKSHGLDGDCPAPMLAQLRLLREG